MRLWFVTGLRAGLALLLAQPREARAESATEIEALLGETVITTASTSAEKASTAPATSVTLTAEDLRTYGIRTLAEAVQFLGLGLVTSNPLTTPDVGTRGVLLPGDDGKHFLVLVNGHAMNDPLYGAARFDQGVGVPFELIDHIEVVIGPGSVLYGSNAMMGVINVITKDVSGTAEGHLLAEYEHDRSVRASGGTGLAFGLFGERAEVSIGAEYFEQYGPDLELRELPARLNTLDGRPIAYRRGVPADGVWGGTVREAHFVQAPSALLRLRVGDVSVSLMGSLYRRGIPYTTGATDVDFDDEDSRELDRALRLDVRHRATLTTLVGLDSRIYADSFDSQTWVNRNARYGCLLSYVETCQYHASGRTEWLGLEERVSLDWLADSSFVTLVGVDGRITRVAAKEDALDYETGDALAPTAGLFRETSALVSPYVQQTWGPARFIDVNVGARLDADERFSPVVSPRGSIALSPADETVLRAVYSQAFRAPTWFETDGVGARRAAPDELSPEIVRSVEGSVEQRFGTQRVLMGVFRTWWEDLVEPHDLTEAEVSDLQSRGELPLTASNVAQFQNVSSVDNYGYNAAWEGSLASRKLTFAANLTEAYTRRVTGPDSEPLVVAPQTFGNARVAYAFGGAIPTVGLALSYQGERPLDRARTPAYASAPYAPALATLRLTLSGPVPGDSGLGYRLSAAYATAASGPYVAGPSDATVAPVLVPVDRFRVFLGLRWDFGTARAMEAGR
jgi:outer membrane cobalamin receptor